METEQELRVAVAGEQLGGKEPGGLGERERRALRGKTLLVRKFSLRGVRGLFYPRPWATSTPLLKAIDVNFLFIFF